MSQVARVEKFEETTFVDPPRQPLPAKPPIGPYRAPKAIFFVWDVPILEFWPKTISFHLVKHI
jgi:hypothetical protein